MEIIIQDRQACPRCKGSALKRSFKCSHCGCVFCPECWIPIHESGGNLVKCPNPECRKILQLPLSSGLNIPSPILDLNLTAKV